jgi:prevent-host-death family protein
MKKKPKPKTRRTTSSRYQVESPRIGAAGFKARCLELMNRVRETGVEYIVTKHGEPVAKLVPYEAPGRASLFGSMKGTVLRFDRPFDPLDDEWDVGRG